MGRAVAGSGAARVERCIVSCVAACARPSVSGSGSTKNHSVGTCQCHCMHLVSSRSRLGHAATHICRV